MSAPLDYVWTSALRQLADLRASHAKLERELAELKDRYAKQVEYSDELFCESAQRTGNLHRALGFDEDADFESDDVYFAKLKTAVEERDNHAANVAVLTSTLLRMESRIARIKAAANYIRPLLACDGLSADHAECSLCVVRDAVFGDEPVALDAKEEQSKRETVAISLLRRIVDESHSAEGGALQTFAPSKDLLAEAAAFVNADDVSAALALVSKYEAGRRPPCDAPPLADRERLSSAVTKALGRFEKKLAEGRERTREEIEALGPPLVEKGPRILFTLGAKAGRHCIHDNDDVCDACRLAGGGTGAVGADAVCVECADTGRVAGQSINGTPCIFACDACKPAPLCAKCGRCADAHPWEAFAGRCQEFEYPPPAGSPPRAPWMECEQCGHVCPADNADHPDDGRFCALCGGDPMEPGDTICVGCAVDAERVDFPGETGGGSR